MAQYGAVIASKFIPLKSCSNCSPRNLPAPNLAAQSFPSDALDQTAIYVIRPFPFGKGQRGAGGFVPHLKLNPLLPVDFAWGWFDTALAF
jgi:hypothetical protein